MAEYDCKHPLSRLDLPLYLLVADMVMVRVSAKGEGSAKKEGSVKLSFCP